MDSLIYSLNATLPVFLVIVVGYVLKQIGILNDGFVKTANKFNFVVTLPVLLFVDLSTTDIIGDFDITYVLYCALVTTVAFFGLWIAAKFLIKDKKIVGEFVQAGYRSSAAILGVAFIQNIYGDSGMAPVMIIGCVPLFNIFAVLVLTFEGEKDGDGKGNIINSLINIVKNPIIIGIVLGVAASLLKIDFPEIIDKTLASLAKMASPLALITIGAGFKGGEIVPTFFIGATFGCVVGHLFGLNPGFAAAIGMIAMFCGVLNCPIASIVLSIELFGSKGFILFAIAAGVSYMLSGYYGLYSSQKIMYSKLKAEYINKDTK